MTASTSKRPSGAGNGASLVAVALRQKLSLVGAASLTSVEWHLLRVSSMLQALDQQSLERFLSEIPLAELRGIADGLDAIGASDASAVVSHASREIDATNGLGVGNERAAAIGTIAAWLEAILALRRAHIEQQMLAFAARQPDLMPQRSPPGAVQVGPESGN